MESRRNRAAYDEAVERFCAYLTYRRRTEKTIKGYREELGRFRRWLASEFQPFPAPHDFGRVLTRPVIERFGPWAVADGRSGPLAPRTVARLMSVVRSFFAWLVEVEEVIPMNVARALVPPKPPASLPRFLSTEQSRTLLAYPDTETPAGARAHVIFSLMLFCGLRACEVIRLDDDDFQPETRTLHVMGKGQKPRVAPLPETVIRSVRHWIRLRPRRRPEAGRALIIGSRGARVDYLHIKRLVDRAKADLDLPPWLTSHKLRHTCATLLWNSGADMDAISALLGHSSPAITAQVYVHATPRVVAAKISPHWRQFEEGVA